MELEVHGETIEIGEPKVDKKLNKLRDKLLHSIDTFRIILNDYFDESDSMILSALESYHPVHQISVFEMACNTESNYENIEDCISVGCDVNKRNPKCGRRPISFAIECTDCSNLEALLSEASVSVDYEHSIEFPFTPINYLLERLSDEDFVEIYSCIELLVQHCADVNIPGKDGKSPIRNILEKENLNEANKKKLLKCFFDHVKFIDINNENGAVRAQLKEMMSELELPPLGIQRDRKFDFDYLLKILESGNEAEFWQNFKIDKDQFSGSLVYRWHHIVCSAVSRGLKYTVEKILRTPLFGECNTNILSLISSVKRRNVNDPNIAACFNLLLNHHKINIDEHYNSRFFSPLQHSIEEKQYSITKLMLERGAYIGFDLISNIKPELLEMHFNSCITTNDAHVFSEDLEIAFDYKNLIPVRSKVDSPFENLSEMQAVQCIMQSCTIQYLLKHPLIDSFLDKKWKRLALIFYGNFFFCAISAVLYILYILVFFLDDLDSPVLRMVCQLLLLCLTGREMFQIISSPCLYFTTLQNYLECILIALSMFVLLGNCPIGWRGNVSAVAILLIVFEFIVLVGSLPLRSVTTHYVMLETVSRHFVKSLLLYSIIIVAFALSFCCLFHKPLEINATKSNETEADEQTPEERYNNFQSVGLSMLKSMVMAIGELDASNINFNDNVLSYFVFVAFIMLVTTILGNLLNGLAVSDINEIRSQAEWTHLFRRCQLLAQYERIFRNRSELLRWFPTLKSFVRSKIFLNTGFRFAYQLKIRPSTGYQTYLKSGNKWFWYMNRIFCSSRYYRMDEDIIKEALKRANLEVNDENEMLRQEISKLAESQKLLVNKNESMGKTMKSIERMLEEYQNYKY